MSPLNNGEGSPQVAQAGRRQKRTQPSDAPAGLDSLHLCETKAWWSGVMGPALSADFGVLGWFEYPGF